MSEKSDLLERIDRRSAVIGIVGLGYVGLPLCVRFVEVGYRVIGFDIDPEKVAALHANRQYIAHIDLQPLTDARRSQRFEATHDFSRIAEVDAILLCVPTPLNRHREPDLSFVIGSVEVIVPHLRPGRLISLESTTYPGTTEEEIQSRVEAAGYSCGEDVFVVYSPEREDPANPEYTTQTIPKVVGGITDACLEVGDALYRNIVDQVVTVSSARTAEMTKILENTYRAVNVALVNELKLVAEAMNIDIFEVIRAAATKPFGFTPFYPGPGLGGHCIPIDPFYLTWKARAHNVATQFIELAGEVNAKMPDHVILKVMTALNHHRKAIADSNVLILGVAYKKNVDDVRESPSIVIIEKLLALGADVRYSDPHVPQLPKMRKHTLQMQHTPVTNETLEAADCVVIATDHDAFDWAQVRQHAHLIVDARGVYELGDRRLYRA